MYIIHAHSLPLHVPCLSKQCNLFTCTLLHICLSWAQPPSQHPVSYRDISVQVLRRKHPAMPVPRTSVELTSGSCICRVLAFLVTALHLNSTLAGSCRPHTVR